MAIFAQYAGSGGVWVRGRWGRLLELGLRPAPFHGAEWRWQAVLDYPDPARALSAAQEAGLVTGAPRGVTLAWRERRTHWGYATLQCNNCREPVCVVLMRAHLDCGVNCPRCFRLAAGPARVAAMVAEIEESEVVDE